VVYDSVDRHLAAAGSVDRAAIVPGIYLAWCVNLGLESVQLRDTAERALLRVRMRDLTGSELLVSACAGVLAAESLNEAGQRFTERYYVNYSRDFEAALGSLYDAADDWSTYDRIAPILTRSYLGPPPRRRWWRFWRR
jgi:hypothetical protein